MSKTNLILGRAGEADAICLLKKNGYRVLAKNYKTKLGEIDIVARDADTVCFVEVKTRNSDRFGYGQEALTKSKQRQISKAALVFLKEHNLLGKKARFDVVSIKCSGGDKKLSLIKNAFEMEGDYVL